MAKGWKNKQQKNTGSQEHSNKGGADAEVLDLVKVLMKSDYRDVAKKGEVYETDAEKAAELVKLGRATYVKKGGKNAE